MEKFKVLKIDVKVLSSRKAQTELADYVVVAPQEVVCPDDASLVITRDGFIACVRKKKFAQTQLKKKL